MKFNSDKEMRLSARLEHQEIFKDFIDVKEAEFSKISFASNSEHILVGHGKQTNSNCGRWKMDVGCLNIEADNAARWFYPDLPKDSVFVKRIYHSCDKPSCPVCYKYGWATREAARIEARLKEASKRFGLVEHIVVSVPEADYGLSYESLQKKVVKILSARGVIGGCKIFHAFRYRNSIVSRKSGLHIGWYPSPHFHILGFIGGSGYGRCRNCKGFPVKCYRCSGFEGVTRRCYDKEGGRSGSGYIVKVLGKRKTVGGTGWYQLNHASLRRGKKTHVATWFGVCSYRKLKLINSKDVGVKFHNCPICGSELERLHYLGDFSKLSVSRRGELLPMYNAEGKALWEISTYKRYKGGSDSYVAQKFAPV